MQFALLILSTLLLSFVSALSIEKRSPQVSVNRTITITYYGDETNKLDPFLRVWCGKDDGNMYIGTPYPAIPNQKNYGRTFGLSKFEQLKKSSAVTVLFDFLICANVQKVELWFRSSGGSLAPGTFIDKPCRTKDHGGYLPNFKESTGVFYPPACYDRPPFITVAGGTEGGTPPNGTQDN